MKRYSFLLGAAITLAVTTQAQQPKKAIKPAAKPAPVTAAKPTPVPPQWVFTFGSDTVYRAEFERLLSKNKKDKEVPTQAEIVEYLELYQNFKMKVKEAEIMKLDTLASFKQELAGYRKQLANPYLTDKKVSDALVKEAYERMKEEINASHILINCAENASPKDTLAAYNKIVSIRNRAIKGESFDSLAVQGSEDPSAIKNYGSLGWFTSFNMIYPFETQAYNTPKGQISQPFRTRFGYHIVKVIDRRPARGEVKVQHIMLQTGGSANTEVIQDARVKADSIYAQLMTGASFDKMVELYSQDQGSKNNGGNMNYFSSMSNYPDVFKETAFGLSKGAISKPFQTEYGYHILKLIDKRGIAEFKEVEENIKNKVGRDSRAESSKLVVAQRIKSQNNYKSFPAVIQEVAKGIDSSFLMAAWQPTEKLLNNTKAVMQLNDKVYTAADFALFLKGNQEGRPGESVQMLVNGLFKKYSDEMALNYEENMLEQKYPDFKNLMQEYHDGILLFDLTDKKVWSKAVTDTAGLEAYYEANKQKYLWKDRVRFETYNCLDAKVKKEAMKMAASGKTAEQIRAKLNKKLAGSVMVTEVKLEKSEALGNTLWSQKGVVDATEPNSLKFYVVLGIVGPEPKELKDTRGIATSDYQAYLEKEWIASLRAKYPVQVNDQVVQNLFK